LNLHSLFVLAKSSVWTFFIFQHNKIRTVQLASSFSFPLPAAASPSINVVMRAMLCYAFFPLSQDELTASTLSSGNALSRRLPSRAKTEALNSHYRRRIPSPNCLTFTLHCYKKIISTLDTLITTQLRLHFASYLARAPHLRSSTRHCRSLSLLSHVHRPCAQWHPQWWTSQPSFAFWITYRHLNSCKKIFWNIAAFYKLV
jgi:hypothetical protein